MIIVKIHGGLGNQLFQYAFGKYAEEKLNTTVKFFPQTDISAKNFTPRTLDLEKFDIPLVKATETEVKKFKKCNHGIKNRIERKLNQKFPFLNSHYSVQNQIHQLQNVKDNVFYDGYFQNHVYVDFLKSLFYEKIKLPQSSLDSKKDIIEKIAQTNSVSIHIRRSDYITIPANAKIYNILDQDYYHKAILKIKQNIESPKFFIFTQDLDWAKENFSGEEFHFVTGNSGVEDMLIMSMCKHNIIGNSTFSWWGAYLNKNENKIVIAPQQWYAKDYPSNTDGFLPPNWIKL